MSLVDEVVIRVHSGKGGRGCLSFRREKFIPFGGPDGGNGGTGGSVFIQSTRNKNSLLDFKYRPIFKAEDGAHGKGKDMDGKSGQDCIIEVPVGTLVFEKDSGTLIEDLSKEGLTIPIAEGGRGGRGNKTFVSSTNRAPRQTTPGEPGTLKELRLELRLMADVGLVGLPNAGKSSLLNKISRAHPKVADYAFTTLSPVLGAIDHKGQHFVVADLPGLIEGAHLGTGLGHKFLRHVSRNRLLLHLVDFSQPVEIIVESVKTIQMEIATYDANLANRPTYLVFTKSDLIAGKQRSEKLEELQQHGLSGHLISSHSGHGIEGLLDQVAAMVPTWKQDGDPESET